MATVTQPTKIHARDPNQTRSDRYSSLEMITLVIGFVMIIIAFGGVFQQTFLGFQLSFMHCLVLASTGGLAVWAGMILNRKSVLAFRVTLFLGLFYLANAVLGFLLDGAVLQRTGLNEGLIQQFAPGFLELELQDHVMHGLFALWFLLDAFILKRKQRIRD
jgi:hypothetical protein